MKLTRYFTVVALFIITAQLSNVQAQSTKKMLVKTWVMSFDDMLKNMPTEQQKKIAAMTDEQRNLMKKMFSQSYYDFKADGTFEAFIDGKKELLTWKLSENGKELITTETNGEVLHLKIVELSKKRLALQAQKAGVDIPLVVFVPKK